MQKFKLLTNIRVISNINFYGQYYVMNVILIPIGNIKCCKNIKKPKL